MVKVAIFAFLIGLSVYQGFTWTRGLDASAGVGDSRNVFITFMAGMGLCFVFFLFTFAIKNIETLVRTGRTRWTIPEEIISGQGDPIEHEYRGALTDRTPAVSQANPASHPRLSADRISFSDLTAALDTVAQAHIQCAEADRQVALKYARVSNAGSNTKV